MKIAMKDFLAHFNPLFTDFNQISKNRDWDYFTPISSKPSGAPYFAQNK